MVGNKKWMIALFSICLVVIAGLLTTVIVLAAPSQTIQQTIGINYTVKDVAGSLQMTYQVAGQAASGPKTATFTQTQAPTSGALDIEEINGLTPTNNNVVFTYTFNNDIDLAYNVAFTYTGTNPDWTVEYSTTSASDGYQEMTNASQVSGKVSVAAGDGQSTTLYIRIVLDKTTADANFSGQFSFVITGQASA